MAYVCLLCLCSHHGDDYCDGDEEEEEGMGRVVVIHISYIDKLSVVLMKAADNKKD